MVRVYCSVVSARAQSYRTQLHVRSECQDLWRGHCRNEGCTAQHHGACHMRRKRRRGLAWFVLNPHVRSCRTAQQIFMKFGPGEFTKICQHIPSVVGQTVGNVGREWQRRAAFCVQRAVCLFVCLFVWRCGWWLNGGELFRQLVSFSLLQLT
jgi:hypothetical protein